MDMRYGTCNARSTDWAGSHVTVATEIARGQEVRWEKGGSEQMDD